MALKDSEKRTVLAALGILFTVLGGITLWFAVTAYSSLFGMWQSLDVRHLMVFQQGIYILGGMGLFWMCYGTRKGSR